MSDTIRSLVAADAAWFLRHHGARCAARQLEKVAAGVVLTAAEWGDVQGDAATIATRVRAADRRVANAYDTALVYLARGTSAGDDAAARALAKVEGETVDQWIDNTRAELARRAA